MRMLIKRFWSDEGGATAIEYGLIVGIIATVIVSIFGSGTALSGLYDVIASVAGALS